MNILPHASNPNILCSDQFYHETFRPLSRRLAPFPLILGRRRPLVGVDTESSEIIQRASHPLFFRPLMQPVPPTSFPNATDFSSLVSSIRGTNFANRIRLLRIIASMLSLPVSMRMSSDEIGWSFVFLFHQPIQSIRKLRWTRRSVS